MVIRWDDDIFTVTPHPDSFLASLGTIDKIEILSNARKDGKVINIYSNRNPEPKIICLDTHNQIIGYQNYEVETIGNLFMTFNRALRQLDLPNVTSVGDDFLVNNRALTTLAMPKLKKIGTRFLQCNPQRNAIIDKINTCQTKLTKQIAMGEHAKYDRSLMLL